MKEAKLTPGSSCKSLYTVSRSKCVQLRYTDNARLPGKEEIRG